jgi:hypothetical protein
MLVRASTWRKQRMRLDGQNQMLLLRQARRGDLQAFEQLVRQHQAGIHDQALQLTGTHGEAFEAALDTFVQLHAAMARISSPLHLRQWLLRAVVQNAAGRPWRPEDELTPAATPADPGPDFTARVMARVQLRWSHRRADFRSGGARGSRRRRRRGLLLGAVVIAGVASILALWPTGKVQLPSSAPASASALPTIESDRAPDTAAPAAKQTSDNRTLSPSRADPFPTRTLIVLPLRHASLDASSLAAAEAFHASLLDELRNVPGLSLLIPGMTAPPETLRSADYLLTVTSLEAQKLHSGATAFTIPDNRRGGLLSAGTPAAGRQWPVQISVQPMAHDSSTGFTSTLQIGEDTAALPSLAARQAQLLRMRFFPDAQVKQQLISRIRDVSLSAVERSFAIDDLLGTQRDQGAALDYSDIGVIVAGASAMPAAQRAGLWRNLRGTANAELVDTLIESMRRDPDTQVRFEALATLAADYGADARVQTVLDSVSREDPAEVMRMAARRTRNGDTEWHRYVVRTLKDRSLPFPERLAPLLVAGQSAKTATETLGMRTLMNDEEIVTLLAGLVRDSWLDFTQGDAIGDALALLAGGASSSASSLLVEIPQEALRTAATTATAAAAPFQVSPAAMSWLLKNRNTPRARRILDDIARGRADPQLGLMIDQMMQQRPPARRPD